MKVLVTGGAGFIGSHVIDKCRELDWDVVAIDSLDQGVFTQAPSYLRDDVEYCFTDLRHLKQFDRFKDVEAIVHLAALGGVQRAAHDTENVLSANIQGTVKLAALAKNLDNLKTIVLGSSFSIYGSNYSYRSPATDKVLNAERREEDLEAGRFDVYCPDTNEIAEVIPIFESAVPNPLETYAASKYMQELVFNGLGLPLKTLRFSSVYGPRLRLDDGEATIIAKLTGWISKGISPKLFEDGEQIRDWVLVNDVVDAIIALITKDKAPDLVNVCSGDPNTLANACKLIARTFESDCEAEVVGGYRPGDMRHCLGDPSRLAKLIGRRPTPFSEGVSKLQPEEYLK